MTVTKPTMSATSQTTPAPKAPQQLSTRAIRSLMTQLTSNPEKLREMFGDGFTSALLSKVDELHQPDPTCVICLESEGKVCTHPRLTCQHVFHTECVEIWFETNPSCPMCKQNAKPRTVAVTRPINRTDEDHFTQLNEYVGDYVSVPEECVAIAMPRRSELKLMSAVSTTPSELINNMKRRIQRYGRFGITDYNRYFSCDHNRNHRKAQQQRMLFNMVMRTDNIRMISKFEQCVWLAARCVDRPPNSFVYRFCELWNIPAPEGMCYCKKHAWHPVRD